MLRNHVLLASNFILHLVAPKYKSKKRHDKEDITSTLIYDYNIISFFRRLRVEFQFCEGRLISYKIKTYYYLILTNQYLSSMH